MLPRPRRSFQPKGATFEFPDVTRREDGGGGAGDAQAKALSEVEQARRVLRAASGAADGRRVGVPTFFGA